MTHRLPSRVTKARRDLFLVVGVKAAPGSLASLGSLLRALPRDVGMAVVAMLPSESDLPVEKAADWVRQCECPYPVSLLASQHLSSEPVAVDLSSAGSSATAVLPDRVYLLPAGSHWEFFEGSLPPVDQLSTGSLQGADHFFTSLADQQREWCVGVSLAPNDSEGLLGLKAISDLGGMTILETVGQGMMNGLSSSIWVDAGGIDHTLRIDEIAIELGRYAMHHRAVHQTEIDAEQTTQIIEAIPSIANAVEKHTEHNFRHYKVTTLVRRIKRRMQVSKCVSVQAYVDVITASRDEATRLFRDLLISVTCFFRDPDAFDALQSTVIRKLVTRHLDQQNAQSRGSAELDALRVWVPGCATGEEAYSLAIAFREVISTFNRDVPLQIFATDLDERALRTARQGSYPAAIADELSEERLKRFFFKRGTRYLVTKEIRDCVIFSSHNLISDPPFTKLDLISCRNLLIYLGAHLQKKLIPVFHYALRPAGYLFLGPAESMTSHKELFRTVSNKHRITQRKSTSISVPHSRSVSRSPSVRATVSAEGLAQSQIDLHQLGQRIALDEFSSQWAIVDDEAQILSVSADTSPFLKLAEGSFQNSILRMAHSSLRVGLKAAFAEAQEKKRQIVKDHLILRTRSTIQRVMVTVQPMPQVGEDSSLYFVAFQPIGIPIARNLDAGHVERLSEESSEADVTALVRQLECELAATRDDLERTVRELETANEELKSSNEELLSMNEELQSANEELETSKDEVQATNDLLGRMNSDLENLLRSTEIATVFLDRKGNIRGFTPAVSAIYGMIASDLGRPLTHLSPRVESMPKLPDLDTLIASTHPLEDTIQNADGRWYIRRVLPYRTSETACDGMVITFADVTDLRESEQQMEAALHGGSVSAWKLDLRTGEAWRTSGHDQLFGYVDDLPEWNFESFIRHIVPDQADLIRSRFTDSIRSLKDLDVEFEVIWPDGQRRWLSARGQPVGDAQGRPIRMYGTVADVTERKNYECALAESEAHLRRIIDNMLSFVGVLDPEGNLLDVNAVALQAGGLSREMVIGKPVWECYWWEYDPQEAALLQAAVGRARQGEVVRYDARAQLASGVTIDVDLMIAPVTNDQGVVTYLIPSAVDITERKRASVALQESEAFNRSVLDSSGDCIKVIDLNGRLISMNQPGMCVMEIDDFEAVRGMPWPEFWPAEMRNTVANAYKAALDGGNGHFVGQCPTGKGTMKWWDVLVTPVIGEDGRLERLLSISRDITESRTLELAMLDTESRFQVLADHMAQLAWMADDKGSFIWFNKRWCDYIGTTQPESQELGWEHLLHPDELDRVKAKFQHAIDCGIEWEDTFALLGKAGQYRWFQSSAMPIRDAESNIVRWFGTNTDISDRIRIEAELDDARRQAEAANQAKSDFLANMSHEIRTPMTAILGFADLLVAEDEQERIKVETIRRNGKFLLELINDILDLSKIEAGKIEIDLLRFSPSKLVEDVCSLMNVRAVESNLELKVEYAGPIPDVIENDPIRVRQILINLVGNAIKFTQEGAIRLRLSYSPDDDQLKFEVIDTGIGISDELQANLFRPFEQGDSSIVRRYGGSGLGLAISQRLAHILGGKIEVDSVVSVGSEFSLSLAVGSVRDMQLIQHGPQDRAWNAAADNLDRDRADRLYAEDDSNAGSGQLNVRVLIVDDRRDIRFLTQHFVRQVGGEVLLAENGKQALELAHQQRELGSPPDIILMDVQMPEMDGLTATRHLRSTNYTGPIIALTANAMDSDRQACLSAGYTDYLSKPIDAMQLIDMLRRYSKSNS